MLQPSDRRHLFESLRPPEGYSLDCAIGTTFTLDLLALLTAPLAFTTFDWSDADGHMLQSPPALLATMQEYADRICLFCQMGKIAIPQSHPLYSYLEETVIEVNAPKSNGIFHPKIWVLRFTATNQPVLYRFLCLSRNLTFDRSWDTILLLDGQLIEKGKEIAANRPLSNFIAALPRLAHHSVSQRVQANVDRVQMELRRVQFDLPSGFEQLSFHPMGLKKSSSPLDGEIDRLLVMSPFVSANFLNRVSQQGEHNILIARPEALDHLPATSLNLFKQVYQISPAANPEDADETSGSARLVGLHAKLYVADVGKKARIWTGSANATEAAFDRNVEFLVELVGNKQQVGIDALLAFSEGEVNFRKLLEPYYSPDELTPEKKIPASVETAQRSLLKLQLTAHVLPAENPNEYRLQLRCAGETTELPTDIVVRCYPMTRPDLATTFHAQDIEFSHLSCQAITSFFAFEIWNDGKVLSSCLLNVPLVGTPADRRQRITKELLQDKNQVLKLLLFLLAEGRTNAYELLKPTEHKATVAEPNPPNIDNPDQLLPGLAAGFPLFEALVRALDRDPVKLDRVARLVNDLLPAEKQLLPDEFDAIWQPIYATHQTLNAKQLNP